MGIIELVGGLIFLGWIAHSNHEEHHHREVGCDLDDVRSRIRTIRCDDETLIPGHIRHRVEDIFEHVEEARCHGAPAIANDVTTPHGRSCMGRNLPRGGRHAEPRSLEGIEIAVVDDRPGDVDDAVYVLIRGEELDCHDHYSEAWRLVRGRHRDWLLDDIFVGDAIMPAIRDARAHAQRRPAPSAGGGGAGGGGAVQRRGGGR